MDKYFDDILGLVDSEQMEKKTTTQPRLTCYSCASHITQDEGEHVRFYCAKKLQPSFLDQNTGWECETDPRVLQANHCAGYAEGDGLHMDEDCEDLDELSVAERALWDSR